MPACTQPTSRANPATPTAAATPLTTEEKAREVVKNYFEAKIKGGAEGSQICRYLFLSEQDPDMVSGKEKACVERLVIELIFE
ncbi:MAG: hypothetical protein AB7S38_29860 [Vulcanimicrobiota bacterium]